MSDVDRVGRPSRTLDLPGIQSTIVTLTDCARQAPRLLWAKEVAVVLALGQAAGLLIGSFVPPRPAQRIQGVS